MEEYRTQRGHVRVAQEQQDFARRWGQSLRPPELLLPITSALAAQLIAQGREIRQRIKFGNYLEHRAGDPRALKRIISPYKRCGLRGKHRLRKNGPIGPCQAQIVILPSRSLIFLSGVRLTPLRFPRWGRCRVHNVLSLPSGSCQTLPLA
jgi:hypothetical protein